MRYTFLVIIISVVCACNSEKDRMDRSKKEIAETEKAFSLMADKDGIGKAFLTYADENAVLNRNNSIIKGHDSIREQFADVDNERVKLTWSPDFVEVAASGDLGYTYGKYVHTSKDSLGNLTKSEGIFHTVWKRQQDGTWKFVWD